MSAKDDPLEFSTGPWGRRRQKLVTISAAVSRCMPWKPTRQSSTAAQNADAALASTIHSYDPTAATFIQDSLGGRRMEADLIGIGDDRPLFQNAATGPTTTP